MSSSKTEFARDEFQGFASCLTQLTQVRYARRAGPRGVESESLTEEQFLEGLAGKDAALAEKVKAWLEAGKQVRQHIEARQDTLPGLPLCVSPSGHAL